MIRKDLIIAILATFCLTATMFLVIPIRSQTTGQYDPSLDVNHDGKMDGKDIALPASIFGTAGDPTVPVKVMNPTYETAVTSLNISWSNYTAIGGWTYTPTGHGYTGGYSKMFIHLYVHDINPRLSGDMNTTVYVSGIVWNCTVDFASYEHFEPNRCNVTIYRSSQLDYAYVGTSYSSSVGEFEVKAETIEWMDFNVTSILQSGSISFDVHTYLANH